MEGEVGMLTDARVTETGLATLGRLLELIDDTEVCRDHRHDQKLGHAVARGDRERLAAAVPAGQADLALIVGIDEAHGIAEDKPFVSEP